MSHAEHVARVRAIEGAEWLDDDTVCLATTLRGRAARGRRRDRGGAAGRLRARPAARPPRARRPRDGLLHLQQRRDRGARARRREPGSSASRSSTGTSITATARRRSSAATTPCSSSRCTSGRSTRAPAARTTRRETTLNVPLPAGAGDAEYLRGLRDDRRAGSRAVRAGARARLRRLRRARGRPARRDARDRGRASASWPRRCARARAARRRRARGRLQPRRRCPASSRPRSTASSQQRNGRLSRAGRRCR